jgi:hypothetical protein
MESFSRGSCLDTLVRAIYLCPGLLQDLHPDLVLTRNSTKCPLVFVFTVGEPVVNHNELGLTIDVKLDSVTASFVDSLDCENLPDTVWKLGKRCDGRQKVTVSAVTLKYVLRANSIHQYEVSLSVHFCGPFPSVSVPFLMVLVTHTFIQDRRLFCREIRILPKFFLFDDCIIVNILESLLCKFVLRNFFVDAF